MPAPPDEPRYWVGLCSDTGPLAWIGLEDSVREEAAAVISELKARGFELELLTGDASEAGPRLAEVLGIQRVVHGASPEDKMRHVQALQQSGARAGRSCRRRGARPGMCVCRDPCAAARRG